VASACSSSCKVIKFTEKLCLTSKLAYLKDSNAAAHSVDSDIFQSSDSSIFDCLTVY